MNEGERTECAPLKLWRKAQRPKVTQADFARDVGVTSNTVARWDRGELNPHRKNWPAVQRRTGMSPRQFLHIEVLTDAS